MPPKSKTQAMKPIKPLKDIDHECAIRKEIETSLFKDTLVRDPWLDVKSQRWLTAKVVYLDFERWVEAADRFLKVLSEVDNKPEIVEEVVQLIVSGKKNYTTSLNMLIRQSHPRSLLAFVIKGINNNAVAAEMSRRMSSKMTEQSKGEHVRKDIILRREAMKFVETHKDRALTNEERDTYLRCVVRAERWQNDSLLRWTDIFPHELLLLALAEDMPQDKKVRESFSTARKSIADVRELEDTRLRQMSVIDDMHAINEATYKDALSVCKEGKEWDHYLSILIADTRLLMLDQAEEGVAERYLLMNRKLLEIEIVKSKLRPLRKVMNRYNSLERNERKLVQSWGKLLGEVEAANKTRGEILGKLW